MRASEPELALYCLIVDCEPETRCLGDQELALDDAIENLPSQLIRFDLLRRHAAGDDQPELREKILRGHTLSTDLRRTLSANRSRSHPRGGAELEDEDGDDGHHDDPHQRAARFALSKRSQH